MMIIIISVDSALPPSYYLLAPLRQAGHLVHEEGDGGEHDLGRYTSSVYIS